MKKNIILYILSYVTYGLFAQNHGSVQQTEGYWQSLGLNMTTGTNRFSGVDGFYELTTCNGIETILIKLVNNNPYPVKAGWKDLMVTKEGQQLSGNTTQDSVTVQAGGEMEGDCSGKNHQLILKLSDFGTDKINLSYFITSGFDFVVIHSSPENLNR